MNSAEAKALLQIELTRYRKSSYTELQRLLNTQDVYEVSDASGERYYLEIEAFWDDRKFGNLRVVGAIDDGGLRVFFPVSDSFILTPQGKFLGE